MKRLFALALVALASCAVLVAPAGAAAPPGKGLIVEEGVFFCNGSSQPTTIVHPGGPTGWIGGQHVVIQSFTFSGPEGTFTATFGNKNGLETTFTCVGNLGPVTVTVVAAAVPPK